MEVLAPIEKQLLERTSCNTSTAKACIGIWHRSQEYAFFENSTVYVSPSRLEGINRDLVSRLDRMSALPSNWDGYGAEAPSPISIKNAIRFIIDSGRFGLPYYFVAPGVNGEVMVEFKKNTKAAEIFFWNDNSAELLLYENENVVLESSLADNYNKLLSFFNG
jgi:hypothetical protein